MVFRGTRLALIDISIISTAVTRAMESEADQVIHSWIGY